MKSILLKVMSLIWVALMPQVRIPGPGGKSGAAAAPITLVQCGTPVGANAATATVNITPTNGNTLIAFVNGYLHPPTITSVADQASHAFTADGTLVQPATPGSLQMFHLSAVSGVTSVTVTWSTSQYQILEVCEVSGLTGSTGVADTTGTANASGATWTSPALTVANAIVFGMDYIPDVTTTRTCAAPWTKATDLNDSVVGQSAIVCYQVVSTSASYQPTGGYTPNKSSVAISGAYK